MVFEMSESGLSSSCRSPEPFPGSPFLLQIINFREPVTLDFLDAELEDENKEEVSRPRTAFGAQDGPLICSCKGHSAPPACPRKCLIPRVLAQLPWSHSGDRSWVTVPWVNLPRLLTLHSMGPQCHPTGMSAHRCMARLCGSQLPSLCPTDPEKHD